jgi:hypothetical protein
MSQLNGTTFRGLLIWLQGLGQYAELCATSTLTSGAPTAGLSQNCMAWGCSLTLTALVTCHRSRSVEALTEGQATERVHDQHARRCGESKAVAFAHVCVSAPVNDVLLVQEVEAARDGQRHVLPLVAPVEDGGPVHSVLPQRSAQVSALPASHTHTHLSRGLQRRPCHRPSGNSGRTRSVGGGGGAGAVICAAASRNPAATA